MDCSGSGRVQFGSALPLPSGNKKKKEKNRKSFVVVLQISVLPNRRLDGAHDFPNGFRYLLTCLPFLGQCSEVLLASSP